MELKFVIDKTRDLKLAEKLRAPKWVFEKVNFEYKTALPVMEKTKNLYQKSWDEIGKEFSEYIEKETGYNWFYPEYTCAVGVVHQASSNWGTSNRIARSWRENPYVMRKLVAHELVISHYFEIIKRNYRGENLKDEQIWALAEIAAFALTSLTKEVKKWWPWDIEYHINHDYPHIVKIQLKLKEKFLKRKNFDEYIQEGIKIIKKYPRINPEGNK